MDSTLKNGDTDENKSSVTDSNMPSTSSADGFDFKSVKNSLDDIICDKSDDEFADAVEDCENLELDEEAMKAKCDSLSEEELQNLKETTATLKNEGNDYFKKAEYDEAIGSYTKALNNCPLQFQKDRSVLYANRAAAKINLEKKEEAVLDCNKALELDPNYLKALIRRAQLHRKLENLDQCLADYKKIMEIDVNNTEARCACATLPAEIAERNEKLKTEMFGKLKELGNLCLRPFGLSTDNFQMVQDPNSGGYSINFQNNK